MSTAVFPSFPSLSEIRRTPVYDTSIGASVSGKETRTAWQAAARIRFELTFEALRETALTGDEMQSLLNFFTARQGRFDTFYFTDPKGGGQVTVRFDQDELEFTQQIVGWWEGTVKLITVK